MIVVPLISRAFNAVKGVVSLSKGAVIRHKAASSSRVEQEVLDNFLGCGIVHYVIVPHNGPVLGAHRPAANANSLHEALAPYIKKPSPL
jgi:hypothetical protein